jgi:hypothetical protein
MTYMYAIHGQLGLWYVCQGWEAGADHQTACRLVPRSHPRAIFRVRCCLLQL